MAEILTPERFKMHREWLSTIAHSGARIALEEMVATIDALAETLRAANEFRHEWTEITIDARHVEVSYPLSVRDNFDVALESVAPWLEEA